MKHIVKQDFSGRHCDLTMIEPIDPVKVKEVMDLIIAQNIFAGNTGTFVSAKEARLVEHNVTEYEIV